jgi:hypothetical protein
MPSTARREMAESIDHSIHRFALLSRLSLALLDGEAVMRDLMSLTPDKLGAAFTHANEDLFLLRV